MAIPAANIEYCEEVLQVFVHDLDCFEEDMDLLEFARIWRRCGSLAGLEMLLQKFDRFIQAMSAVERFRFFGASISSSESAASYAAKIEQCRGLPSFDHFYQNDGASVLHHVAEVLGMNHRTSEWESWTRIGITAIQSGADVHVIKQSSDDGGSYTPFLQFVQSAKVSSEQNGAIERILKSLKRWTHMLREAKFDLPAYFLRESEVWTSANRRFTIGPVGWYRPMARLVAINYDTLRQRCSLHIRYEIFVPLSRLHHLPGSFTNQAEIPDIICWEPNSEELGEGHWSDAGLGLIALCSNVMNQDEFLLEHFDAYHGLGDSTQDDNGILMRMIDLSSRNPRSRKRSSSQPAPLSRRRYDYGTLRSSNVHKWLPPIHFCITRWTWIASQDCHHSVDARSCVKGHDLLGKWVSESCWEGFLNRICQCQTGYGVTSDNQAVMHDGTPDCPQGCGNIDLSTISRPPTLPYWHPGSYP
jgi:hypothetical protein